MELLESIAEIKLESNLITLLEVFIYILTEIVCLMEINFLPLSICPFALLSSKLMFPESFTSL